MTKVVFIFGAGASKSVGVPVMIEFLDRAHDVLYHGAHVSRPDFERVFKVVAELQILHAKSTTDLRNVESVFNLIEMGRLVGRLPGVAPEEIQLAADSMRSLLAQTIEFSCLFPRNNGALVPGESYRHLAEALHQTQRQRGALDWSFITFNYDIALDFALQWKGFRIDYGLDPNAPPQSVGLFKLHGSLNWTTCQDGAVVPLGFEKLAVRERPGANEPLHIEVTTFLNKAKHCDRAVTGVPAIVPPSWNKTEYHQHFALVWKRAAAELANAENIVVVGYSLPESDAFFHDLFRLGVAGPTRVKRFVVVNPDPDSEDRFRRMLGPELEQRFEFYRESFEQRAQWLAQRDW